MSVGKFLNPQNDVAFKHVFGKERNKDILIHFINDMLRFEGNAKIQNVTFLKTHQDPDIAVKKQSILDVLCADERGRQYIVEMQVVTFQGFEKRAQYYAAKAYSGQLNRGEKYHELKEVIFLAITNFVMFPDKEAYKSDHVILDKETYSHDLKDFSFTFIELPKFNKSIDDLTNIVEKWTYFFKHAKDTTEEELSKLVGNDVVIEKAYKELNRFSWTEIELNTYEQEEKHERDNQAARDFAVAEGMSKGIAQGIAQGIVEGNKRASLRIAKEMRSRGVDDALILQFTGLSQQDLNQLEEEK